MYIYIYHKSLLRGPSLCGEEEGRASLELSEFPLFFGDRGGRGRGEGE